MQRLATKINRLKTFNLDTQMDSEHVHPKKYCHKCYTIAKKSLIGAAIETATVPFQWATHRIEC